jgi:predicted transcriptional regulator
MPFLASRNFRRRYNKMGEIRLHEGELNVMELLWSNKALAAKDIAKIIKEYIGWEKNTTYTVIKRLIDKGAIIREDPGFICRANVTKRKIQDIETQALLNQLYNGSVSNFITAYLAEQKLSGADIAELKKIISSQSGGKQEKL